MILTSHWMCTVASHSPLGLWLGALLFLMLRMILLPHTGASSQNWSSGGTSTTHSQEQGMNKAEQQIQKKGREWLPKRGWKAHREERKKQRCSRDLQREIKIAADAEQVVGKAAAGFERKAYAYRVLNSSYYEKEKSNRKETAACLVTVAAAEIWYPLPLLMPSQHICLTPHWNRWDPSFLVLHCLSFVSLVFKIHSWSSHSSKAI